MVLERVGAVFGLDQDLLTQLLFGVRMLGEERRHQQRERDRGRGRIDADGGTPQP